MGKNDEYIVVTLRDLMVEYGEDSLNEVIRNLTESSEYLEEMSEIDENRIGGRYVKLCMEVRDRLLDVIPSGLGVDNFYVVAYSKRPFFNLSMMIYPYQNN